MGNDFCVAQVHHLWWWTRTQDTRLMLYVVDTGVQPLVQNGSTYQLHPEGMTPLVLSFVMVVCQPPLERRPGGAPAPWSMPDEVSSDLPDKCLYSGSSFDPQIDCHATMAPR